MLKVVREGYANCEYDNISLYEELNKCFNNSYVFINDLHKDGDDISFRSLQGKKVRITIEELE